MRGRRVFIRVIGPILAAALLGCPPKPTPPAPGPPIVEVDVGFGAAQRDAWRFTSEGSDLAPVDLLRALIDVNTGKPFTQGLDRYGFLPSPVGPGNPYGLPIGFTVDVPDYSLLDLDYVGVNCSACHTAQLDYGGTSFRIDGGSNMADIEALALAADASVQAMLSDPEKIFEYVLRLILLDPPAGGPKANLPELEVDEDTQAYLQSLDDKSNGETQEERLGQIFGKVLRREPVDLEAELAASGLPQSQQHHLREVLDFLQRYLRLIANRLESGVLALNAFKTSTVAGPGRDDPWNIIRNLLFLTPAKLNSPVSIPTLYESGKSDWIHWDANTNSVLQRNIAQAVALGAYVDGKTDTSTLRVRAVWELEELMDKLNKPAWPEQFPPIDQDKAARGAALFAQACVSCHRSVDAVLSPLPEIGTDPNRAESFLAPQGGQPFPVALVEKVQEIEKVVYRLNEISPEEAAEHEVANPVWRATGQYSARNLTGIWSGAPYLHNGSVPTLYDLLLPAARRPAKFPLGHHDFDPKKVGFTTDVAQPIFTFDVTITGNANTGHEFGANLSDDQRWDLIEFLKTQ